MSFHIYFLGLQCPPWPQRSRSNVRKFTLWQPSTWLWRWLRRWMVKKRFWVWDPWSKRCLILSKALFTRDISTHNIAIKRYCNKKSFLSQYFFSCENWKYLFLCIWIDFEMSLQYFDKKCLFIFLLQYLFISILWAKILCVNKA